MKVILTESQIKRVLEQKNDLITSLKEMGFVPSGNGVFKHSQKPELTVTLAGDVVIVKNNGQKIAEIKISDIEDLEGTIKSTSLKEQTNPDVKKKITKIQNKLISLGYNLGKTGADGFWGPLTDKAWKDYKTGKKSTTPSKTQKIDNTVKNVKPKDNVLVSDTLVNKHIVFDPKRETKPFKCSEEGCAEWVSNQLDDLGVQRQGNAWHSHNIGQKNLTFTPFMKLNPSVQNQMANLFTKINANPVEKSQESAVKTLVSGLIPDQSSLKDILKVNDIVGLFYNDSSNFTKAFFEGATGMGDMGEGSKITDGPYFIKKDGTPWTSNDLGKNLQFYPGKSLKSGSGFGMNTHLGYVGAKVNGEPIIFHNVHSSGTSGGQIYATPLSKMGKTKIFWVKKGPGEVIVPKEENKSWYDSFLNLF